MARYIGRHGTGRVAKAGLISSVPSLITFTGSTPVGRGIGAIASGGEHLKHVA